MAASGARGLRHPVGDRPQLVSNSCHWAALRPCRTAHDQQLDSPSRRSHLLRALAGAAVPVAHVYPPDRTTAMTLVPFAAAVLCLLLALARLLRTRQSIAGWCFVAGMVALAIDIAVTGIVSRAGEPNQLMVFAFAYDATLDEWLRVSFIVKSFLPIIWLGFSVTY